MLTLWIDVSPLRTGGRTVSNVMSRLARGGFLLHRESLMLGGIVGYEHSTAEWRRLLQALNQPCIEEAGAEPLTVALQVTETRASEFWTVWLPLIREFRQRPRSTAACTLHRRCQHDASAVIWQHVAGPEPDQCDSAAQ